MDTCRQNKLSPKEEEKRRHEMLIDAALEYNTALLILVLLFSRFWALMLFIFSLYCWFWFYRGYKAPVIDEWEVGYIGSGLRYLRNSVIVLAVVGAAVFYMMS